MSIRSKVYCLTDTARERKPPLLLETLETMETNTAARVSKYSLTDSRKESI